MNKTEEHEGDTAADNSTATLQLEAEIIDYDTTQVTVQPAGNFTFNAGTMAGTLLAFGDVTVMSDGWPAAGNTNGRLANTGISIVLPMVVSGVLLLVSTAGLYFGRQYWCNSKIQK